MILYLGQGFMVGIWSQTKTAHLQLHHGGFILGFDCGINLNERMR